MPVRGFVAWASQCGPDSRRVVARDRQADVEVSTVFLMLDHNFSGGGPPILWETMVFGDEHAGETARCSGAREQAEAMHAQVLARVLPGLL